MSKIVGLGEYLLRLTPAETGQRFAQADDLKMYFGGSEANVLAALAEFGDDAYYVTKIPEHAIGQSAVNALKRYGVHTDYIVRGGDKLGLYYAEAGAALRPGSIIYDRRGSAFAQADPDEFDWDAIFEGADLFHWSGITPALSASAARITERACQEAKKHHVKVSCDLNYRGRLWKPEEAQKVMRPLMQYVDICVSNEADAYNCLGYPLVMESDNGRVNEQACYDAMKKMAEEYGFEILTSTISENRGANDSSFASMLYDGNFYVGQYMSIDPVVERIGPGDSFTGGLLHALLKWKDRQLAISFAAASAAVKYTMPGDMPWLSEAEVLSVIKGNGDGSVQR